MRLCSLEYIEGDCNNQEVNMYNGGYTQYACACNTDLCNAAVTSVPNLLLTSSMTFGTILFKVMVLLPSI